MFLKSVSMNAPYQPKLRPVFTISDLRSISMHCDAVANGLVYRAIFLLAYFVFFLPFFAFLTWCPNLRPGLMSQDS